MADLATIRFPKSERAQKLIRRINALKEQNVSHGQEYGENLGFGAFEDLKQRSCANISGLFDRLIDVESMMQPELLEKQLGQVEEAIALLEKQSQDIKNILAPGVHHSHFPQQRSNFLISIQNSPLLIAERIMSLELFVQVLTMRKVLEDLSLDRLTRDLNAKLEEITASTSEARRLLDAVKDRTARKGMEDRQESFEVLASEHSSAERGWFVCLSASALGLISAVVWVLLTDAMAQDTWSLVTLVVKRLLVFAIAAVFLRISLSKYNSERNLVITFRNRGTALRQFLLFEASLADDRDAKNLLRLEIARYLFSDPKTGLTESGSSGEVNISPVVQMLDRLGASKGT